MTSVLGFARTFFVGGSYRPEPLPSLADEVARFHQMLAMLRRLAGSPVPPEDFSLAAISADRLGADQPAPVSPDRVWDEAPSGWKP